MLLSGAHSSDVKIKFYLKVKVILGPAIDFQFGINIGDEIIPLGVGVGKCGTQKNSHCFGLVLWNFLIITINNFQKCPVIHYNQLNFKFGS